uniref:Acetylcholine receptor subunit alpha-type des-2 n=1 Tax=Ascaris suum TaxID=6253 RepID=F1LGD4_ASCSU
MKVETLQYFTLIFLLRAQKCDTATKQQSMNLFNYTPTHYRLYEHLMSNYNRQLIPKRNLKDPVSVRLSIELYQIIEVNEPQQFVLMNAWVVERWTDELLYWNPADFENISEILLPYDNVWIPDTTLYNSLVMDNAESRRLLNVKLTSDLVQGTTLIEMLYLQRCINSLAFSI